MVRGLVAWSRCVRVMAAFDADAAEEWLGEEVSLGNGRSLSLSDDMQALLLQGFKDDVWTEDDIVPEGSVVAKDDLEVWKAIVSDYEAAQSKTSLLSDKTRTWRWLNEGTWTSGRPTGGRVQGLHAIEAVPEGHGRSRCVIVRRYPVCGV